MIVNLFRYLSSTFGKGFSEANLWNIRQFYLTWSNNEILYTLCRELSWSHIRLIMRLDSEKTREYYLNESRAQGWSVRTLERSGSIPLTSISFLSLKNALLWINFISSKKFPGGEGN